VAFNGEVKKIEKDGTNPHFKSAYATLDNIIDETRPILHRHGLTVMQFPGGDGEKITVRTMVVHESGEWIESEPLTLKPTKFDPQGSGSAITYARRYSYAAALSLSLGDDDDGNEASKQPHDYHQNSQNASQSRQAPQPTRTTQPAASASTGQSSAQARVYKLREEMGWEWKDLNAFAADVLNREIKFLKNDIKSQDEWAEIERAMMISKEAS
jgi:hypothetical protein